MAFRLLEDRLHHEYWSRDRYDPKKLDTSSYEWRLFLALVTKIKQLADTIHADLVIFPATDETEYKWHVSWYRYPDTEEAKKDFLSPVEAIKETMPKKGIKVVNNTLSYERARNDPHVTVEGNKLMAEDIFHFLTTRYESVLRDHHLNGAVTKP